MADVWVSRKKWTCQYCNVTINDDVPSRQHHESGGRHKGNVERALQNLYKKGERERKDAQAAKREMDRIERLAAASYAKDLSAAAAAAPLGDGPTADPKAKVPPTWKPKNKLTAYGSVAPPPSTQEVQPSEQSGPSQATAVAGDWEEVRSAGPSSLTQDTAHLPSEREQAKSFRINEKVAKIYSNDDEDEDLHLSQIKVKKRKTGGRHDEEILPPPVWSSVTLVSNAPTSEQQNDTATAADSKPEVGATLDTPAEPESAPPSSLFKKRKSGSGAGAKKVRAIV